MMANNHYHDSHLVRNKWGGHHCSMNDIFIDADIKIRPIRSTDAQPFFQLIDSNRTYLKKWLTWLDNMPSITAAERYIESRIRLANEKMGFCFLIFSKETIAGVIHLVDIDHTNRKAMIGYWVGESFCGKGLATKATEVLLSFALKELNLHRIEIRCAVENKPSEAIAKKLSFHHEGVLRESEWLHDRFVDQNLYSKII